MSGLCTREFNGLWTINPMIRAHEMVVFDVPPAADPVYARQRGMEAISAALRSNSRAPRAPLAPGPQMMTRQQMEALGVEMQSHAGQMFAMMNGETSIFNYANAAERRIAPRPSMRRASR